MEMSIFEQAERLLKAFKMDMLDPHNNEIALRIIKQYETLDKAIAESIKAEYNRFRFTPEILLHSMLKDEADDGFLFLKDLSNKLYAFQNAVFEDSIETGESFKIKMESANVIKSLKLEPREAWTLYYAGGKEFIQSLSQIRDGEMVLDRLKAALIQADKYLKKEAALSLENSSEKKFLVNKH